MADTKVLFSKTSPLDQHHQTSTSMEDTLEKPPTYEESAQDLGPISTVVTPFEQMITCPPTTSIDANGSITISMDKLPSSTGSTSAISGVGVNPSTSINGSSVSVDQMAEEVTALQRAYIHLYKRVHHFKSQMWYAGLAFVTLFLGFLLFFLAAYHPGQTQVPTTTSGLRGGEGIASHRTGKALVGGGGKALDLVASNALDGSGSGVDHHDDTELLLKHLSRIATTTTMMTTSSAVGGKQDSLATSELFSSSGQKISASVDNGVLNTAESVHSEQTVKVMDTGAPSSSSGISSTSTTTMTTTTTTEVTDTEQTSTDDHHPTETPPKTNNQNSSNLPPAPHLQSNHPNPSNPQPHPQQDTYNISIVIHSATVPNMDYLPLGRASDTYCDVFIDDVLVGSTPIIDNNNNPNWHYLLPKAYKVRAESTIRVDLLDRDHLKRDHIGGVVMLVGDLVNTNRLDRPVKFFHGRGDVWVSVKLV